jgi:acyl-CoA synthetase (AMP-forming)/AMP-acid ligase II
MEPPDAEGAQQAAPPPPPDLFRLFEDCAQSTEHGRAVAVVVHHSGSAAGGAPATRRVSIDYRDLLAQARGLARVLRATKGFVALYARPSISMIVGVLGFVVPLAAAGRSRERGIVASLTSLTCDMHCTFVRVLQSGSAYVPLDPTQPALRKAKIFRRLSCCLGCVVIEAALWLDERERWLRSECARLGVSVVLLGEDGSVTSEEPATAASKPPGWLSPTTNTFMSSCA